VNNELVCIWKEAVVVYFKTLSQMFPGGSEGSHGIAQSGRAFGPEDRTHDLPNTK